MNNSKINKDTLKAGVSDACGFFKTAEGEALFDKIVAGCTKAEFEEALKPFEEKMNPNDKEFVEKVILPCFVEKREEHPNAEEEPKKGNKILKGCLWGVAVLGAIGGGILLAKWVGKDKVASAAATATDAAGTVADATTTATTAA